MTTDQIPLATVTVDDALCLGSEMCVRSAPALFRLVGDVSAPVDGRLFQPADVDLAVDASHGCPFGAIEVTNAH